MYGAELGNKASKVDLPGKGRRSLGNTGCGVFQVVTESHWRVSRNRNLVRCFGIKEPYHIKSCAMIRV